AWGDLSEREDAPKVSQALSTLAGDPQGAVALLRRRLQPARGIEPAQLAELLADLDSPTFAVRTKAFAKLDQSGDTILVFLREHLAKKLPLETARRVKSLVDKHDPANPSADRLRKIRAVELLEHLRRQEARDFLAELAQGNSASPLTRDARGALERLTDE